jgi:hypothetical protein
MIDTAIRLVVSVIAGVSVGLLLDKSAETIFFSTIGIFVVVELIYRVMGWRAPRG